MIPGYQDGDYLVISKSASQYSRGDVVVFRYPNDPNRFFISRIIAVPGDTIGFQGQDVVIDGVVQIEPYILDSNPVLYNASSLKLSVDEYYVMGDNRANSSDSRIWGPLEEGFLVGQAGDNIQFVSKINKKIQAKI